MIGIITDTHENDIAARKIVKILKDKKPDIVVHCGDIISPLMLEDFEGLNMKFVFGNNDGEKEGLNKRAKEFDFEEITGEKEFEYKGKKFWVCHGQNKEKLEKKIKSQQYDYILTGHTHQFRDDRIGKTRVINTGHFFVRNPNGKIGLLDVETDTLELVEIN